MNLFESSNFFWIFLTLFFVILLVVLCTFFYLVKKIKTLIFFNQLHRCYVQQAGKYEVLHENVCFLLCDYLLQLIFIMNLIFLFFNSIRESEHLFSSL